MNVHRGLVDGPLTLSVAFTKETLGRALGTGEAASGDVARKRSGKELNQTDAGEADVEERGVPAKYDAQRATGA